MLLFFCTETTEHVDEALVVANSLILEILVSGVRLFLKHKLVLVVKKEDVRVFDQKDGVV